MIPQPATVKLRYRSPGTGATKTWEVLWGTYVEQPPGGLRDDREYADTQSLIRLPEVPINSQSVGVYLLWNGAELESVFRGKLAEDARSFRNSAVSSFVRLGDEVRPYRVYVSFGKTRDHPGSETELSVEEAWTVYATLKPLFTVLATQPVDYEYATVYVAWQLYGLAKFLWRELKATDGDRQTPDCNAIDDEFGFAYRALAGLLANPRYRLAFRMLWFLGQDATKRDKTCLKGGYDHLIRDRLRLSMFLDDGAAPRPYEDPYRAPGGFHFRPITRSEWAKIELHSRFHRGDYEREAHRLVRIELLPGYNLGDAFRVSKLMIPNRGWCDRMRRRAAAFLPILWFVTLFGCLAFLIVGAIPSCRSYHLWSGMIWGKRLCEGTLFESTLLGAAILAWLLLLPLGIWTLGLPNATALVLPRITGGISIGYFLLFVGAEPWYLVFWVQRFPWIWAAEWIIAFLLVGIYIYNESLTVVLLAGKALPRTAGVALWTFLQASVLGILYAWLSTQIVTQIVDKRPDWKAVLHPTVMGYAYPIAGLLTFAPIAVLLGLVLQFLWEDKPITASVWQPDAH